VVYHHDASPVLWDPYEAGDHSPFLVPDGANREADVEGKLTWGKAYGCHASVVVVQSAENQLGKASMYVAGEHHLVVHSQGSCLRGLVCSWGSRLESDQPETAEEAVEEVQGVVVGHIVKAAREKALYESERGRDGLVLRKVSFRYADLADVVEEAPVPGMAPVDHKGLVVAAG
jgi:hypothetical protein